MSSEKDSIRSESMASVEKWSGGGSELGSRFSGSGRRGSELVDLSDSEDEDSEYEFVGDESEEEKWRPALSFIPNTAFGKYCYLFLLFILCLLIFNCLDFDRAKSRLEEEFNGGGSCRHSPSSTASLVTAFRFNLSTAVNMIRALGALLIHLDQQRIGVEFEDPTSARVPIRAFLMAHLNDLIEVDEGTRQALEIFYSAYNPKSIRRKFIYGNARKEGMSLLKLCNVCRSSMGRNMLKYVNLSSVTVSSLSFFFTFSSWFERPTKNPQVLRARQDAIHYFYQDCNVEHVRELRDALKNLISVRSVIKGLQRATPSVSDWKNLYLVVLICALMHPLCTKYG